MPNPKTGTVTFDVGKAVQEIKAGKVEFRVDKTAIIHAPIGKISFDEKKLEENAAALIKAVLKAKPAAAKGKYFRTVSISSTMGPGVEIDTTSIGPRKASEETTMNRTEKAEAASRPSRAAWRRPRTRSCSSSRGSRCPR